MSKDSLRGLVQLVSGLGDVTVARANAAARDLVSLTGLEDQLGKKKLAKQVQAVTKEIMETAEANRAQVASMVRTEVESALGRADVARLVDLESAKATTAALLSQVEELTNRLRGMVPGLGTADTEPATPAPAAAPAAAPAESAPAPTPARKRPARRSFAPTPAESASAPAAKAAPAKKAPVRNAPAKQAPAKKAVTSAAAKKATAKAVAKKTPAKKTIARTSPATKATATKATAKRATAKKATGA